MWLLFTLLACLGTGTAYAMQKHGVARAMPATGRIRLGDGPRVLRSVLSSPLWLLGVLLNLGAGGFTILALDAGEVSVVQPLLQLTVAVTFLVGVGILGERLTLEEWGAAAVLLLGGALLSVSAFTASPGGAGASGALPWRADLLAWVAGGSLLTVGVLVGAGYGLRGTVSAELAQASGAGLLWGLGNVLIKLVSLRLAAAGGTSLGLGPWLLALLTDPLVWGVVVTKVGGFVLFQLAFTRGRVAVITPVTAIWGLVVPVVAGVLVFGDATGSLRTAGLVAVVLGELLLLAGARRSVAVQTAT
ncbi:MAG: hypothetical protein RBU45_17610 [Myxococcota bacterium]|jgi:drug/metabolite transporter (DMT)-like permease|nr:hypothetical protein [Myxococcota bacterium]